MKKHKFKIFFKKYAFVVIKNILSPQECDETVSELWSEIEQTAPQVKQNDTSTWANDHFPTTRNGMFGHKLAAGKKAWSNRQSPTLHKAFSLVLGTEDLMVSADRFGILRPSKNVEINGQLVDKPEWKSQEAWFHWDLNPWQWVGLSPSSKSEEKKWDDLEVEGFFIEENNGSDYLGWERVQGLVALAKSQYDDGGFQCVPGFHHFLKEWALRNPQFTDKGFVRIPQDDPIWKQGQRITLRKGSLVIWSSQLPHCSFPNNSSNFRICQYIKMFPTKNRKERALALKARLPKDFQVSKLGHKLFGLDILEN